MSRTLPLMALAAATCLLLGYLLAPVEYVCSVGPPKLVSVIGESASPDSTTLQMPELEEGMVTEFVTRVPRWRDLIETAELSLGRWFGKKASNTEVEMPQRSNNGNHRKE